MGYDAAPLLGLMQMGFLDGLLGSVMGSAAAGPLEGALLQVVTSQLTGQQGGQQSPLTGIVSAFEQAGLGHIAQTWVNEGDNHPVSPDQVHQALGADQVQAIADQTGLPQNELLGQLAQMLPGLIERMAQANRA